MKKLACLLTLICLQQSGAFAQNGDHQMYANYWYPSSLLAWTPASDTSSAYNRGTVPLATRFIDTPGSPCFVSKNPGVKLVSLSIVNAHTSGNPSQGYDHAGEYDFGFWQYNDYFVIWGGSAGEGLILAPNPTWIDAGHRNGVKVMGNIFMPPNVYGGNADTLANFLQNDGLGNYPVAQKLIDVANYYGFDGWFMNEETSGGGAAAGAAMQGFMAYFQAHKAPGMELMYYDAMLPSGAISYQNALNSTNAPMFQNGATLESNSMFLNFNWSSTGLTNSKNEAVSLSRDPFDLYAGIDLQSNGYNTNVNWTSIFPTISTPKVSVGLYIPSWTFQNSPDQNDIPLFYTREEKFWNGGNNSPCDPPATGWPGFAKYFIEKSVINSWPFITRFNTGQGTDGCWIDGVQASNKPWHNLSDQDVLPTWRWVAQSTGTPLSVNWDFTDAYNGGNSLKVSGNLGSTNTTTIPLYNTKLLCDANSNLAITYKTGAPMATNMKVALAFTDAPTTFVYVDCGSTATAGWETKSIGLNGYAGKTLCVVALQFASAATVSNFAINIGEMAFTNASLTTPAAPNNVHLASYTNCENAELDVTFDASTSSDIWYYDIYRIRPDNSLQWLGRTPNSAYYIKNIKRINYEANTTIAIIAVNKGGLTSVQATQSFVWPVNAVNNAIKLNGTDKYLDAGTVNLGGNAITLEAWVNANSFKTTAPNISAIAGIDATGNEAVIRLNNNKAEMVLNIGGTAQTLTSAGTLNTGTWYHIAGTYDGTNINLYINGALDATMPASGVIAANGNFRLGLDSTASGTSYFDGMLDEVRAWTVARSQPEITSHECVVSSLTSGLAACWTFNDCTETVAYDFAGNNHDGTPMNITAADWVSTTPCSGLSVAAVANEEQSVKLYPNPVMKGNALTLELSGNEKAEYYIYNTAGEMLQRGTATQKQTSINVDDLAPGIYLYRVVNSSKIFAGKITVM